MIQGARCLAEIGSTSRSSIKLRDEIACNNARGDKENRLGECMLWVQMLQL